MWQHFNLRINQRHFGKGLPFYAGNWSYWSLFGFLFKVHNIYLCLFTICRPRITKVFAKAGLDNVTSPMCKHRQWFGLDVHCSAFVFNFNKIFSIGHLYRADEQWIPCLRKYLPLQATSISACWDSVLTSFSNHFYSDTTKNIFGFLVADNRQIISSCLIFSINLFLTDPLPRQTRR